MKINGISFIKKTPLINKPSVSFKGYGALRASDVFQRNCPENVAKSKTKQEKKEELANMHVKPSVISDLMFFDDDSYEDRLDILKKGVPSQYLTTMKGFDFFQQQKIFELMDKGVNPVYAIVYTLYPNMISKLESMLDSGEKPEFAEVFAPLQCQEQNDLVKELYSLGVSLQTGRNVAMQAKSEADIKRFSDYAHNEKRPNHLIDSYAMLSSEKAQRIEPYLDEGKNLRELFEVLRKENDSMKFEYLIRLALNGVRESSVQEVYLSGLGDLLPEITGMVEKGINIHDAVKVETINKRKFDYYLSLGCDEKTASVLSSIDYNIDNINETIDLVSKLLPYEKQEAPISPALNETFGRLKGRIGEFLNYANSNLDEITENVPSTKNFTPEELLLFLEVHFNKNTTKFDNTTLTFDSNLTDYLSSNPVSQEELGKILTVYPMTDTRVGELPSDWTEGSEEDNIKEKVFEAIEEFQKNSDIKALEDDLSEVLSRSVSVRFIEHGLWGTGYKIEVEGSKPLCLKTFHSSPSDKMIRHGSGFEIQAALFANKHFNDFAKMYFGKVARYNTNEGFLVTQFLDNNSDPEECLNPLNDEYGFYSADSFGSHNRINGKIFDFGDLEFYKKDTL